jgi:hypothetical protein
MAEPRKAPIAGAHQLNINIDANYNSNVSRGAVDNGGEVKFNCAPTGGALIYTDPADSFDGETNGYLTLPHGDSTYTPSEDNFTITYCCCAPGSSCPPESPKAGGGYSITVGSPPEGGKRK